MAKLELIQTITMLSRKVDDLMAQLKLAQERAARLEEENSELRKIHEDDISKLQQAQKDIEFLSLSHRLADNPEALVDARKQISQLIRTIDSCIRLINQD